MNFIRFLDMEKDNKKKSIPYNFSNYNLSGKNFISDMYRGFESIDNRLSIFSYENIDEKNRLVVNYELSKRNFKIISNKIRFIEFTDKDLESLNIKFAKSSINKFYDNLASQNHYDMEELTSDKLVDFILYFNQISFEKNISRTDLKKLINKSFINQFINTNSINPYLLQDYKLKIT